MMGQIEWHGVRRANGHLAAPPNFDGPLEVTVHAASLSGHCRILLATGPEGLAVGEDGLQEEPDHGWFAMAGDLQRFCFVNAAERASNHVTPFLLCGPHDRTHDAVYLNPTATTTQPQVRWSLRLWSSGRRHESLHFEKCRLAGYTPRIFAIVKAVIDPFRVPDVQLWTTDTDYAAFWDWEAKRMAEDRLTRRGLPGFQGENILLSTLPSTPVENPAVPATHEDVKAASVVAAVPQLLEGWFLHYSLSLKTCEVLLIANPEDRESAMLAAQVSLTALMSCKPGMGESFDVEVQSLSAMPALTDKDSRWLPLEALPGCVPLAVQEGLNGAGLWRAHRNVLEQLSASFYYSLEPRRIFNSSTGMAPAALSGSGQDTQEEGGLMCQVSPTRRRRAITEGSRSPWDAEIRIPRCVSLNAERVHFWVEDGMRAKAGEELRGTPIVIEKFCGLSNLGLVVRCGNETHVVKDVSGEVGSNYRKLRATNTGLRSHFSASSTKASPTFTWNAAFELSHEFVTAEMSAKGDVEVLFEVVNLGSTKLEEEGEGWPILATGTLLLDVPLDEDDDGEGENAAEAQGVVAGYKVTRDVSLIGLGAWEGLEGRLQAHVRMGLRLLSVTMHEIRHLLTLAEEVGRDARPFLQASLGDFHSQTEQLSGLPDEIIEHEMVFAAEGKNVVLCLELKTFEGRVHERIRAQAMLAVGREGNHRGLLPLKDTKGTVLCEVRVSVDWIDSFRGDSSTSDHGERVGAKQSPRFVQALQVLRRQLFVIEPEAAVIQKISLHFSALEIHGTDVDWAVLLAMLQSFRNLSNVRSAPSVDDTAENSALTRRLSRTSSSNQLREGIEGDARERWWKRTIYGIFKEVDQDNDGRLTRSELVRLLHQVAAYLCLTRSEACEQIERLLHNMDWDRQVEKGTRASDQAISWPGLREALIGSVHIYSSEHAGWLFDRARCREYASTCVALKVFPGLPSSYLNFTSYTGSSTAGTTSARHPLGAYLASLEGDPADPLTLFWEVVEHELGERRGNVGSKTHAEPGQSPSQAFAALQGMLVRALKNYKIAKDAWGLIIVPAIHKLPLLRGVERDGYEVMSAPVSVGDGVYSDIEVELVALPYMLASQTLTGLRTPHKDRKLRGSRVVSFHVSQAATLYLCYDRAIPKIPAWLMEAGFRDSNLFVRTTMATHRVLMLTTSTPCRIVLGGNEGYAAQKGWYKRGLEFFNYFILIGTEKRASETTPASLLPGRWLLQEHSPAFFGGQPLHDHLFAALGVNGARLTPLRSAIARDSTGKYITKTIEADIRSELKPKLHMEHNIHFSCPRVYLGLLDTSKSRDLSSKLAIRAEAITVNVSFERPLLEEADWLRLGRTDRLEGDLGLSSLDASYFNPALTAPELVIEPWGCRCLMRNRLRSAVTTVRIEAPRYFNLNISPSLADVIRDVWRPLRFDLRRYRASFDKNSDVAHKAARVVLINRLGVPLSLSPSSHGCRVLILPQPGTTGSNEHLPYVKADDSNAPPLNERSVVLEEGGRVELELDQIWNNEEEYVLPGGMRRGKHCIDLEPLGWQRVSHVGVGLAGVQAYHLTPVDHHRTHRRTQSARTGPVHSNEKWPMWTAESNSTAQRGNISSHALQHHQLHNSSSSHKSPRGDVSLSRKILMVVDAKEPHGDVPGHGSHAALHVEVRTNVRLKNMTGVVVDTKLGRGGDGVRAFLSPRGAMVMPLSIVRQQPMLSLRRLAQDDMEAVSGSPGRGMEDSGVLLHPALFDARTHEALRRTRGLEERSLALHHRVIGTVAANVATQHCEVDAGNTKDPVKQKEGEDTNLEGQHASPKKIQSPSTPDAVKARSSQTIRSQMAIDWIIAILPPYQLSNTLPCLVHIEAFQPEHTPLRGRRFQMQDIKERKHNDRSLSFGSPSSMRQGPVDPASDIFSLPLDLLPLVSSTSDARVGGDSDDSRSNFEYASNRPFTSFGEPGQKLYLDKVKAESTGVHESGEKTPVGESHENMVMVWSGCIESGHHTNLELVKLDRSLYVRVRLMGEAQPGPWSLPVHIPPWAHLNRTAFNADRESGLNEGLELWWMESGNGSEYHGDARFVRRWRLKGARRLALCADYWIINKTGLALSYRPTPLQERGGRTGSPLFEDATTGEAHAMESAQRHSPLPFEATTAPPTLGATAQGANCRFISDGIHRRCFGRTTRLPLLVSCPAKTLRTMPYALSCEALNAPLFISELRIETYGKDQVLPATVIRCFETGFPLFTNSDIRVTELPAPVQERLRRPDGVLCILRERLVAKQSNSDQQDLQDGNEMVTFVVSEDSYVYAFCCRNRPGDDSEEERENVLPNAPSDLSVRSSDSKGWLDDELKDLIDKSDARLNVDDERLDAKDNDLSLYWNGQMNGTLRIMAPLFDTLGRDWSSPFNVDAISTTGQVETPSAVLGVSVKPLPGIFHRTRAVTLWPRFIVINRLRKSVDVLPLLRSRCLDNQSGGESGGRVMRNTVAAMLNRPSSVLEKETLVDAESNSKKTTIKGTKPLPRTGVQATPDSGALKGQLTPTDCYGVLHAGECMAIYGFLPLRFLPSNLLLPAALKKSRAAALQHHSTYQMRDDDKDETAMAHALCFRLHNADTSDESQQYSFSHPVLSEDVGETCVWFWRDSRGVYPGPLVSANVTVHASTVFMTLRDSTLSPPYRIENRSSWAYLRCKQSGTSDDTFAVGPMAYKSFSWQERDQLHRLNVSVEDIPKKDGGGPASSVATAEYSLDEVGPKETMLIASRAFFSGSGVGGFGVGGVSGSSLARSLTIKARPPQQKLYVHVSTAGRTRVITFSDLPRDDFRNRLNEMALLSWTWSLFQELYNSLDIHVGLAGFTLNLLDMDGSGRRVVELLSLTLDRLEIRKEGGKDRAQLALYHIQLDDMRPGATFAVIIQPADSGWHTPARRSKKLKAAAMAISLSSTGTGTEQQTERLAAAKEDEHVFSNLVPLVRVTAEPELHTPWSEVVHFRGLELSVQELEMRVDLDTLFSLVAYIGRLSRFDSEREERAPTGGDVYHHYYHHHRDPSIRSLRTNIMDEKSISLVRRLLRSKVRVPDAALSEAVGQRLVYIELFHHSSLIVGMELVPGGGNFPSRKERTKQTGLSGNRMDGSLGLDQELDEALVSGLELIGTGVVQLLADMARSLAQLSGLTLVFNELLFTHYFGSHYDLGHIVALSLRQQAITQSYKLLGAMDLLGNPLNLFLGFGSGVVEFFRRTQAELVGDADSKGEGLRRLAKAVIGGPFSSVSKITGTVASLLEEVVGVREMAAMAEEGMRDELSSSTARAIGHQTEDGGGSADGWRGRTPPPQHLGEGILKGGEVFYKSVKSGVKNIYDLPQQGASREGFSGFLKGMGKGVVGALAAPLIGTLGGISRVTDTTAYFEKPRILRRRRAVRVALESHALPLLEIVQVVQEEGEERREECDEKSKFEEPELRRGQKQF
ncbi:hypothetical protein NSK_001015 [Nannochloropsis salina CCMP1776]|uniref:EF-hand domain-containing protein n=1 Tax=Nannochloropsis salina CCMP1776 TaxID=1027361 RepID=A0A4D9DDL9_9STRA|nr:hypothetical protein NSK_001015 [Nannochloropsis salina CCMP1776]|eukprot:TFJ87665.1 hypothetical protein NSK_001015 [Nannochloropsis salina CCMP1776]